MVAYSKAEAVSILGAKPSPLDSTPFRHLWFGLLKSCELNEISTESSTSDFTCANTLAPRADPSILVSPHELRNHSVSSAMIDIDLSCLCVSVSVEWTIITKAAFPSQGSLNLYTEQMPARINVQKCIVCQATSGYRDQLPLEMRSFTSVFGGNFIVDFLTVLLHIPLKHQCLSLLHTPGAFQQQS